MARPASTLPLHDDRAVKDELTRALACLGKKFVSYHPTLAKLTGSPKAALMLGHALFMTRVVTAKQPERKGWFWKTAQEWQQATGLTVREVETARRILTELLILEETRQGMPARLWFRVDLDRLSLLLCKHAERAYRPWSWEEAVMRTLIGRPVIFYAPLAWIAQSATAGLYLSALLTHYRYSVTHGEASDGWFTTPASDICEKLHFGVRMAMNARSHLRKASLIEEARENCMQAKLVSRLCLADLPERIELEAAKFHCLRETSKHESGKPDNNSCSKRESRNDGSAEQHLTEARNNSCPNRVTSSAETSDFSNNEINTPYLLLHNGAKPEEEGGMDCSGQTQPLTALVFPEAMLPAEKAQAEQWLTVLAVDRAQLVLDELTGQIANRTVRSSNALLKFLIAKERAGELVVEFGHQVADRRVKREAIEKQRKQMQQPPSLTGAPAPTSRADGRERMAAILSMFGDKR